MAISFSIGGSRREPQTILIIKLYNNVLFLET